MAFRILSIILFDGEGWFYIVTALLRMAGLWLIFRKCGEKGWKSVIPSYRYLAMGRCAGCELEGLGVFWTDIALTVLKIVLLLLSFSDLTGFMLVGLQLALYLVMLVTSVRLYRGMIELFGTRRRWMVLWVLLDFIPSVLWGFLKRYQPNWKLEDLEEQAEDFFSGQSATVLEKGLTVNLEHRTARDMMRKKTLLRDIHLDILPGNMVLLLGGSGAGKTTFINAVNGYEPAKAQIMLNGSNVYADYKRMKFDIGFVPQQDLMRDDDTVLHTLLDAAALRLPTGFTRQQRRERVDEVMDIFGLTPVKESEVEKLSGGQRKRLSIAMEFLSNPSLFILDEPDSGLDGVIARELMSQLRAIADQGKIVMVVTHTPDRCADLFDHVLVLAKDAKRTGRLAFYGEMDEARRFFGCQTMEEIVKCVNRTEEGGKGLADDCIRKYAEVRHAES